MQLTSSPTTDGGAGANGLHGDDDGGEGAEGQDLNVDSDEENRLQEEKIRLAPVPSIRSRPVVKNFKRLGAPAEDGSGEEAGAADADQPNGGGNTSTSKKEEEKKEEAPKMSDAMKKRMESSLGESEEARRQREAEEQAQRDREELARAQLAAKERLEADREGRKFFPHFNEAKSGDRIKFTKKQKSLPIVMAQGDLDKAHMIQYGPTKMVCIPPRGEHAAITYLDRKIRQSMALEKKRAREKFDPSDEGTSSFSIAGEITFNAMSPLLRRGVAGSAGLTGNGIDTPADGPICFSTSHQHL